MQGSHIHLKARDMEIEGQGNSFLITRSYVNTSPKDFLLDMMIYLSGQRLFLTEETSKIIFVKASFL